jgi:hypothetical protein
MSMMLVSSYLRKRGDWLEFRRNARTGDLENRAKIRENGTTDDVEGCGHPAGRII